MPALQVGALLHPPCSLSSEESDNRGSGSSKGHTLNDYSLMDTIPDPFVQNLFVLRHGEQLNQLEVQPGAVKAARPWDPPLTDKGKLQAWTVGRNMKLEDWNITRVVMSPSLRCVQTAVEIIAGLCMLPSSLEMREKGNGSPYVSTIKASIECGLAEMMNRQGVPYPSEAADKNSLSPWTLDLVDLYMMLPEGVHDTSFQPIRKKLPLGKETLDDARNRYTSTFQKIANRFPNENILCITHGEGVMQSVSMMWPRVEVHGVTYCAYTHAQRPNFKRDNDSTILCGDWELLTESGSVSGVFFGPSP
ncbi:uncharacterized protein [Physcomitrium patens]|uniref:uncharacterized protein isoform X1 n=1 Tax=Physcomitrium patens TaxID=3218 RepID=UPI00024B008D|nr:uncharacterized protein LOC112296141 isoform X1 [Physcomitrium patens]|eukprot:XP_024404147.1 uncharacterized protein LOC112296141 isoform X1 [Physcomitrella patens]